MTLAHVIEKQKTKRRNLIKEIKKRRLCKKERICLLVYKLMTRKSLDLWKQIKETILKGWHDCQDGHLDWPAGMNRVEASSSNIVSITNNSHWSFSRERKKDNIFQCKTMVQRKYESNYRVLMCPCLHWIFRIFILHPIYVL